MNKKDDMIYELAVDELSLLASTIVNVWKKQTMEAKYYHISYTCVNLLTYSSLKYYIQIFALKRFYWWNNWRGI